MNIPVSFKLILITDDSDNKNLYEVISRACTAGVKAIQLRKKNISASELLTVAKKIRSITAKYNAKLIINDRYDVALLSSADGLHSPEHGIEPKHLINRNGLVMGKSVHSLVKAKEAEAAGFDYIMFGPVFATPSKEKYGKPQGLENLKEVCNSVKIPVFAVGGINPITAKDCIDSGAHGVAVIREIMVSKDVKRSVSELVKATGKMI